MSSSGEPKVFISYAWGTDDYQNKVMDFCNRLYEECGVEVIIDKWSMQPGDDTYSFMERCVIDSSIDYVIMLLDKNYADKADSRQGGVGAETQIISREVYSKTSQCKYVPVVFQRDGEGNIHKPTYLRTRLHFDLTKDNSNNEFMRLIKHLYGEATYPMPMSKGKKPDWVSEPDRIPPALAGQLFSVQNARNETTIRRTVKHALEEGLENIFKIVADSKELEEFKSNPQDYLLYLGKFRPYRDTIIKLLSHSTHEDYFTDTVADFLEAYRSTYNDRINENEFIAQARNTFLHELFIYIIALLWNAEEFFKINNLVSRTYFISGYRGNTVVNLGGVAYASGFNHRIDNAKNEVDNKSYLSGVAQLWSEHVMTGYSLGQIVFADTLIYNLCILEATDSFFKWFPLLYVFSSGSSYFSQFAFKLKSSHQLERYAGLFGDSGITSFREKLPNMVKIHSEGSVGYAQAVGRAPLILDYVDPEEISQLP